MNPASLIVYVELFFLVYFLGFYGVYLVLNLVSLFALRRHMQLSVISELPQARSGFDPPISLIVPAYNEAASIVSSINSLLQLNYPEFEVVVVNDGSKDNTLEILKREFKLIVFPEAYRIRLRTKAVKKIYVSTIYPNVRVIDKENGGKADSLNAGINSARYPLFCGIDADSILQRDTLRLSVQPFLEDPKTVACGGTIRIVNGCRVRGGFLERTGLPRNPLALFQVTEYLRAFLFGRLGWSSLNALLIVSGAFGVFHKETVMSVGGYKADTLGEDMELVMRLHRVLNKRRVPYRIAFIPEGVCWTEAPEDLRTLRKQRVRWQHGLGDSLMLNRALLFSRRSGAVGWLALPFFLIFEWMGPVVELAGYVFVTITYLLGLLSFLAFALFLLFGIGLGVLLSASSLLLEEMSFRTYPEIRHLFLLFIASFLENVGYQQLTSYWRLEGIIKWIFGRKPGWGEMKRTADWQAETSDEKLGR